MTVIRHKHRCNYTQIPNAMLQNERLSVEAKGALAYMLSRPPNWTFRHDHLQKVLGIGRQKFERIMCELIGARYVKRSSVQPRDANNRFLGYKYVVCDLPFLPDPPSNDFPQRSVRRREHDSNIKRDASRTELTNSYPKPLSWDAERAMVGEQYTAIGVAARDAGLTFVFEGSEPYAAWREFRGNDGMPPSDIIIKDGVKRRGTWMTSLYPPTRTQASEE